MSELTPREAMELRIAELEEICSEVAAKIACEAWGDEEERSSDLSNLESAIRAVKAAIVRVRAHRDRLRGMG